MQREYQSQYRIKAEMFDDSPEMIKKYGIKHNCTTNRGYPYLLPTNEHTHNYDEQSVVALRAGMYICESEENGRRWAEKPDWFHKIFEPVVYESTNSKFNNKMERNIITLIRSVLDGPYCSDEQRKIINNIFNDYIERLTDHE